MKFITSEWLKSANDDIETMREIQLNPNLTQIAAFHAEQAVEKSFKAIYEERGIAVPKIHDLIKLFKQIEMQFPLTDHQINMLMKINELYIDSRYPGELGLLPYGKPSMDDAREFLEFAEYIYVSVKKVLEEGVL